jgi:hypothetical protein
VTDLTITGDRPHLGRTAARSLLQLLLEAEREGALIASVDEGASRVHARLPVKEGLPGDHHSP